MCLPRSKCIAEPEPMLRFSSQHIDSIAQMRDRGSKKLPKWRAEFEVKIYIYARVSLSRREAGALLASY
jgi:hypothetical protein